MLDFYNNTYINSTCLLYILFKLFTKFAKILHYLHEFPPNFPWTLMYMTALNFLPQYKSIQALFTFFPFLTSCEKIKYFTAIFKKNSMLILVCEPKLLSKGLFIILSFLCVDICLFLNLFTFREHFFLNSSFCLFSFIFFLCLSPFNDE